MVSSQFVLNAAVVIGALYFGLVWLRQHVELVELPPSGPGG